jgi:hypothetical protein
MVEMTNLLHLQHKYHAYIELLSLKKITHIFIFIEKLNLPLVPINFLSYFYMEYVSTNKGSLNHYFGLAL